MNGQVQRIGSDDPMFGNPYEISLGAAYDDYLVAQAGHLLHFVTADSHSAENLERLFEAPLLQPYLHLFWVIYGGGGNGKGILLGSPPPDFSLTEFRRERDRVVERRKWAQPVFHRAGNTEAHRPSLGVR